MGEHGAGGSDEGGGEVRGGGVRRVEAEVDGVDDDGAGAVDPARGEGDDGRERDADHGRWRGRGEGSRTGFLALDVGLNLYGVTI